MRHSRCRIRKEKEKIIDGDDRAISETSEYSIMHKNSLILGPLCALSSLTAQSLQGAACSPICPAKRARNPEKSYNRSRCRKIPFSLGTLKAMRFIFSMRMWQGPQSAKTPPTFTPILDYAPKLVKYFAKLFGTHLSANILRN